MTDEQYISDMKTKLLACESQNNSVLADHPNNTHALAMKPLLDDLHTSMDNALTAFDTKEGTTYATQYGGRSKRVQP